jgi:putative sterol carrier protein
VSGTDDLRRVMERFAAQCSANERLRAMNRDWFRTVAIQPRDGAEAVWVRYEGGPVRVLDAPEGEPDLVVEAPAAILTAVFTGVMPPTEPYLAGDLTVQGSQDDVMRLDIISLLIWGE